MAIKLREEARGRECLVRIPQVCNGNPETTILAHLNNKRLFGVGTGQKAPDIFGAHCCSSCHDVVDGRVKTLWEDLQIQIWFMEGCFRTMNVLMNEGKLGAK